MLVDVVIVVVVMGRSVVINTVVDESEVGVSRIVMDAVGLMRSVDDVDALRNSLESYLDLE